MGTPSKHQVMEVMNNPHLSRNILQFLSQQNICKLASVCRACKKIAYEPRWWHTIELRYNGTPSSEELAYFTTSVNGPKIGLYSSLRPPQDSSAFKKLLLSMLPSKERFVDTTSVQFKNYLFTDATIAIAALLFPSLKRLDLDGGRITIEGMKHIRHFSKLYFLSVHCKNESSWDSNEWLAPLEPHLETLIIRDLSKPLFLKRCMQCNFFYNPKYNTNTSCLYHPMAYSGYGHSCSSYECCGSNTPCYMGTPGCTYGFHTSEGSRLHWPVEWHPELYGVPYKEGVELGGTRYLNNRRPARTIDSKHYLS
jgi:hypothetical protein